MRNRLQIPIRCAAVIDAPAASVRRALNRSEVWSRAARAVGGRLEVAGDPAGLAVGGLVRFSPRRGRSVLLRIGEQDGLPTLRSALSRRGRGVEIRVMTASTGAGTLTTVDLSVFSPVPLLSNMFRPILVRHGEMLLGITTLVAREPLRVVAGAVIADGKVLLALRRDAPGKWELPGGKVEPGESDRQALQRELLEELALHTTVFEQIGAVIDVEPGVLLVCYRAEMAAAGQIVLTDHDQYQWVGPDALDAVDLLESDRQLVESLRLTLQIRP